jgi:hypothetical protein
LIARDGVGDGNRWNKKKRHFWIILLVLTGTLMAPVSAADWYVSTTGDNTDDGSSSYPWRTIAYAVGNASVDDGDTIHIAAGTYAEWNINIATNLTLTGAGAESTIVDGMETSSYSGGVFKVMGVTAAIEDLTIRNGSATHLGGGVSSLESSLTIADVLSRTTPRRPMAAVSTWTMAP